MSNFFFYYTNALRVNAIYGLYSIPTYRYYGCVVYLHVVIVGVAQ